MLITKVVRFLDYRSIFKERLILLRHENKCTQTKLASQVGVDKTTINKYEKGTASPSYEMLWKLSEFFDVSVDYLIGKSNSYNGDPTTSKAITEAVELIESMSSDDMEKAIKMLKILSNK